MLLDVIVHGQPHQAILDTGSALSLMSKPAYDRLAPQPRILTDLPIKFTSADGLGSTLEHSFQASVTYLGDEYELRIFLLPKLPVDFVLGLDFCRSAKVNINFDDSNQPEESELRAVSRSPVVLPSHHPIVLCFFVSAPPRQLILLEPSFELLEKGVFMAPALVETKEEGP